MENKKSVEKLTSHFSHITMDWKNTVFTLSSMLASVVLFLGLMLITMGLAASMEFLYEVFPHTPGWIKLVASFIEGLLFALDAFALAYAFTKQFIRHFKEKN